MSSRARKGAAARAASANKEPRALYKLNSRRFFRTLNAPSAAMRPELEESGRNDRLGGKPGLPNCATLLARNKTEPTDYFLDWKRKISRDEKNLNRGSRYFKISPPAGWIIGPWRTDSTTETAQRNWREDTLRNFCERSYCSCWRKCRLKWYYTMFLGSLETLAIR